MAVPKTEHSKELQKTKAATGVQPQMMKWHFSKSAKITRWRWLLAAGITFRHATEGRVQAWITAARAQQGRAVTPPSCGTSSWVLCQQTSSYCLHVCTRNTLVFSPETGSSAAPMQEICVWEEMLRTPRKSQIVRRIPVPCFAGSKAGWAEGSAPSGCILYKREGKACKPDWFPL